VKQHVNIEQKRTSCVGAIKRWAAADRRFLALFAKMKVFAEHPLRLQYFMM